MEIKDYVQVNDAVLPWPALSSLLKYINTQNFEQAIVGGAETERIDFNIRNTYTKPFNNLSNSMSEVHWCNLLHKYFKYFIQKYNSDLNLLPSLVSPAEINDIQILKYNVGGFYRYHTDHFHSNPRTYSCILLLNDDYEGGHLNFMNTNGTGEYKIDVKPNRMIIWPSNFMFPHCVAPVTKGVRYSIVSWAL
jgi:Rps23 Pro-64 3,4-dihydroxylase Tpa1-like proline 4-hydroxylase